MQKRKVIRSERRVRSLEKERSCKGRMVVNARCITFNVPTSDGGRREYRGTFLEVTWAGVLQRDWKHRIQYDTRHITAKCTSPLWTWPVMRLRTWGSLCCSVPQKNGALTGTTSAGVRLVSPAHFCVPGDYDVNYERRSLKVNASGRTFCARGRIFMDSSN